MLQLAGITIFTILFMSIIFGVNPADVIVTLGRMPIFQVFFLTSVSFVFIYSFITRKYETKK